MILELNDIRISYTDARNEKFNLLEGVDLNVEEGKVTACSTYEVLQILSISLTDKTHLTDLFDKTKFNDVKELDCPLIPGLFD